MFRPVTARRNECCSLATFEQRCSSWVQEADLEAFTRNHSPRMRSPAIGVRDSAPAWVAALRGRPFSLRSTRGKRDEVLRRHRAETREEQARALARVGNGCPETNRRFALIGPGFSPGGQRLLGRKLMWSKKSWLTHSPQFPIRPTFGMREMMERVEPRSRVNYKPAYNGV